MYLLGDYTGLVFCSLILTNVYLEDNSEFSEVALIVISQVKY